MPLRILVGIQNASPGEVTFALAADWATRFQGSIVGVGIIDESVGAPASMLTGGAASMGNIAMADAEALRSKAEKSVAQALGELETLCRNAGVEYRNVTKAGDPEEVIGAEAQACDVVLLGQAAPPDPEFGVPARTILESTLRNSPRPVVVVPRHVQGGQGVEMSGIRLFVFGGIAQMDEEPETPLAEFMMAIAGPIASVLISIVALGFYTLGADSAG